MDDPLKWLSGFEKYGSSYGLERVLQLADRLGNPQDAYSIVHVAGSNGKGSVSRLVASILTHAGYRTGLYLSPHLERFNERISINNEEITDEELKELILRVKPLVEWMTSKGDRPTYFEIVTILAFLYFKEKNVDYAVIETGLGGRLDATNIVKPLISVITNISLEHTDILGDTLEAIAEEKAGIIKPGAPVITAAKTPAREVIKKEAEMKGSSFITVDEKDWERLESNMDKQVFLIHGGLKDYRVHTKLLGLFQGENIALALRSVEEMQLRGVYITDEDILEGVSSTVHPGRLEVLSDKPFIIIDGAHNPNGVDKLVKTLIVDVKPRCKDLIVVFGVLKDKDVDGMLRLITPISNEFIITKSNNPRACEPSVIHDRLKKLGLKNNRVIVTRSVHEAVDAGIKLMKNDSVLCVTGSLYTVGEARGYIKKRLKEFKKNT